MPYRKVFDKLRHHAKSTDYESKVSMPAKKSVAPGVDQSQGSLSSCDVKKRLHGSPKHFCTRISAKVSLRQMVLTFKKNLEVSKFLHTFIRLSRNITISHVSAATRISMFKVCSIQSCGLLSINEWLPLIFLFAGVGVSVSRKRFQIPLTN